jgi:hypothetical protein
MNVVGRKLTNSVNMVGRKLANAERVGMKQSGNALGVVRKISDAVDVGARKIANTSARVNGGISTIQPYLQGIPGVEQLGTLGRDASKAVQLASQGVRRGAQVLERESQLGQKAISEMPSSFI